MVRGRSGSRGAYCPCAIHLNPISRPSKSALYRPTDSFEDISIVTTDLQTSLGREKVKKRKFNNSFKVLEDKLISIKNLVLKHASSSDFTSFIEEMRDEMENLPGDMQPSKIMHDEKRLDR